MKFIKKLLLLSLLILSLGMITGCSNQAFDEAMKEGKVAIANNNLDAAKALFEIASETKPKNEEAKGLYDQVTKLIEATELKDSGDLEDAKSICTEISNIETEWEDIKEKAKDLSDEIDEIIAENEAIIAANEKTIAETQEYIDGIEIQINNKEYEEARKKLDELKAHIENNDLLKSKIESVNTLIDKCNEAEELARQHQIDENKKNDPLYPLTLEEARDTISEAYPDYTCLEGHTIDYDDKKEPAYVFTVKNNETQAAYAAWVYKDRLCKLQPLKQN